MKRGKYTTVIRIILLDRKISGLIDHVSGHSQFLAVRPRVKDSANLFMPGKISANKFKLCIESYTPIVPKIFTREASPQ